MADGLYQKYREEMLNAANDLTALNIKAVLIDAADYTVDLTNDEDLADIPAGARVATSANLTTKTVTGGVFDSDDVTFSSVTGDESEAVVLYIDTGTPATSRLIVYRDSGTGLPVTPNGGDITVAPGANGWFRLLSTC